MLRHGVIVSEVLFDTSHLLLTKCDIEGIIILVL